MKKIFYPTFETWKSLTQRPSFDKQELTKKVSNILENVKINGDKALFDYAKQFDKVELTNLSVSKSEIESAILQVSEELKAAIEVAKTNITKFHESQILNEKVVETTAGVQCWRKSVGIEKVGLYIPSGTAPLFSTILMLAIPAKIAGCKEIILCTPSDKNGNINPIILYVANLVGITAIFKVGGSQAIAAMTYGTESIPQVYKIFGPGNQFVMMAKTLIQQEGIAIDMPAGPSEVLVIADETANADFVAADLLAQAEHGTDSQVILLTTDKKLLENTLIAIEKQVEELPRKEIVKKALENSLAIVFEDLQTCMQFSNEYAPEHLIIATKNCEVLAEKIVNAGSVFLGNYTCESAGDYASGTNHTLPTSAFAKSYSGVSLDSFCKKITFQKISPIGLQNLGKTIEIMAEAESLQAHKNAVTIRLKEINS